MQIGETIIERVQLTIEQEWVQLTREEAACLFAEKVQPEDGWHAIFAQEYLYEEVIALPDERTSHDYLVDYLTWTVVMWRWYTDKKGAIRIAIREVRVGWDEEEANFLEIAPRAQRRKEAYFGER